MKPTTRKELFMAALAEGCECSVEPVTREEKFLAAQAKREASGGSGGGGYDLVLTVNSGDNAVTMHTGSYAGVAEKMRKGIPVAVLMMEYSNDGDHTMKPIPFEEILCPNEDEDAISIPLSGYEKAIIIYPDDTVEMTYIG